MTIEYISKLHPHFFKDEPLDVAVFACLMLAFWSTARLGELTITNLDSFDPLAHVKQSDLGERVDRNCSMTIVIHVPKTKADSAQGEDLYWARQE